MRAFCRSRLLFVLLLLGGTATAFAHPGAAISVTSDGRVFFVDTGGGVFSIGPNRTLIRHDGPAFHWFAFDPQGRFRNTAWPSVPGGEFRSAGTNPTVIFSSDFPVAIATNGKMYYPDPGRGDRIRLVAIDTSGARSLRAVLPPVESGGRPVTWLNGIAAGPNASLYYTEDRTVRKVDVRGQVTVVAANVTVPNCTAIPGIDAPQRPYLRSLAVAPDGTVYVAASGCGALLKIDARGKSTVVLRTAAPWSPTAVALANGNVYVLEYTHTVSEEDRSLWLPRVRMISPRGVVTTLAAVDRR
ncbi:MAG TPA: hypothetical protein VEK57_10915 [Thermoanaerobaculia bacterium]|nr:hypothetical protein [Thermoanaerobaculia bacterium]